MGECYDHLDLAARIEIYRMHELGWSRKMIAAHIGRHPSTVGRELARNGKPAKAWRGGYDPQRAQALYERRRRWDCRFKMARQPELRVHVRQHLAMGWSPEQIAGRLALGNSSSRISHESIYRYIYHRVAQKDYWNRLLPRAKSRRGHLGRRGGSPASFIKNRKSIAGRPEEAQNRALAGHWENDGMAFLHNRKMVLLAHERTSRFTLAVRQNNRTAALTLKNLKTFFETLPPELRRSTTFDNGTEFALHWKLNHQLGMATYFCDPRKPWQKGGIENAIGRLRRWLPSTADPGKLSQRTFDGILRGYNTTPRKCLGFKTPTEALMQNLEKLHFNRDSTFPLSRE